MIAQLKFMIVCPCAKLWAYIRKCESFGLCVDTWLEISILFRWREVETYVAMRWAEQIFAKVFKKRKHWERNIQLKPNLCDDALGTAYWVGWHEQQCPAMVNIGDIDYCCEMNHDELTCQRSRHPVVEVELLPGGKVL